MSVESAELLSKIQSYWNKKIDQYLKTQLPDGSEPKVPIHLLTNHISNTLLELLKWWVNNDIPYTSQQMDQYFQELINPCITSVLSDTDSVVCPVLPGDRTIEGNYKDVHGKEYAKRICMHLACPIDGLAN